MGKVLEKKSNNNNNNNNNNSKKKKKGRPSLLDLQKRNLKQQKHLFKFHNKNKNILPTQNNNNNNNNNIKKPARRNNSSGATRRSTRRNPNPNLKKDVDDEVDDDVEDNDDDDDDDVEDEVEEREENENCEDNTGTTLVENEGKSLRKRKVDLISSGSEEVVVVVPPIVNQVEKESVVDVTNQTDIKQGTNKQVDGPVTPLPDKKLLLFILDRLQKKDTYGVFAEPVDQDELPDYHEIIEHPMDFTTVRKKLEDGSYGNLEQFEKDIFLICSNAMQYNAPDTVYFRQAGSIQELARKNFENLRQDSGDDKELDREPKIVRRGRPPKNLKRPPGRPPLVRANSDFSEATLATAGGTTNRLNNESKKGSPHLDKYGSPDSIPRTLVYRNSDSHMSRSAERFDRSDDMIGSASKGISMKHGKRQIVLDETRRNTYKDPHALARRHDPSVLATFHGERKQLIAVGLHTEYGYARSLAQFASKLGPVAWKVASKKIERCLPSGVKFGQGWVGENEAPSKKKQLPELADVSRQSSTPTLPAHNIVDSGGDASEQKPQLEQLSNVHTPAVRDSTSVSSASMFSNGQSSMVNMVSTSTGPIRSANSVQIHQIPAIQSRVNGVNGTYGLNFTAQMGKMIGQARPNMLNLQSTPSIVTVSRTDPQSSCPPDTDNNSCGVAKLPANPTTLKAGDGSSDGVPEQKVGSNPPDLNAGFQSPGSSGSRKADSVQPDLALQL